MSHNPKTQAEILAKLKIEQLNPMQEEVIKKTQWSQNFLILSPTGSGKTLAYLLPLLSKLHPKNLEVQSLIIVPSRELAIQIDQTLKEMGCGYKVLSLYGGRSYSQDKRNLVAPPAIIIGTPGRIAEHLRKETFGFESIHTIVVDEFDKSLQAGFDEDMQTIFGRLKWLKSRILTSATSKVEVPEYVEWDEYQEVNYLPVDKNEAELETRLERKMIFSEEKDKLGTLIQALKCLSGQSGIVFFNYKDAIERVSEALTEEGIPSKPFHGKMTQPERERSLLQFRNGSSQILLATDLAGRGIDVPDLDFVMHFHLPLREEDFIHRNGRTARMTAKGTSYVLHYKREDLPYYVGQYPEYTLNDWTQATPVEWVTLEFNVGRKSKISKGDVAGFLGKQCELGRDDMGKIEIQPFSSFAAVRKEFASKVIEACKEQKLKKLRVKAIQI